MKPTTHPPSPPPLARWQPPEPREPRLAFAPIAWLKLMFFLHAGGTEVGGFGICAADDPLYVQDFVTVKQRATCVTVSFDDEAVADYFDGCADAGLPPARFARIWCHTHPGDSPEPSYTDEETFAAAFGACDWSVMFIVSRTGRTYARLSFAAGPGGTVLIPVGVDWAAWPQEAADAERPLHERAIEWMAEYQRNVQVDRPATTRQIASWGAAEGPEDLYPLADLLDQAVDGLALESMVLHDFGPAEGVES
jgi:hypothetical protein